LCKLEDTCKNATRTHFRDFVTIEVAKHISGAISDIEVTIVTVFMVANFKVRHKYKLVKKGAAETRIQLAQSIMRHSDHAPNALSNLFSNQLVNFRGIANYVNTDPCQ
jgi:hypothetical protein